MAPRTASAASNDVLCGKVGLHVAIDIADREVIHPATMAISIRKSKRLRMAALPKVRQRHNPSIRRCGRKVGELRRQPKVTTRCSLIPLFRARKQTGQTEEHKRDDVSTPHTHLFSLSLKNRMADTKATPLHTRSKSRPPITTVPRSPFPAPGSLSPEPIRPSVSRLQA